MNKGTLIAAAAAIGLSAVSLVPDRVTAAAHGVTTQFLRKPIRFFRPFHHHRNFNNMNGAYNGFYGYPGYYMSTYDGSTGAGQVSDDTGSVRTDPVIMPPPPLSCQHSREVVTVPSEADGTARQITITRC